MFTRRLKNFFCVSWYWLVISPIISGYVRNNHLTKKSPLWRNQTSSEELFVKTSKSARISRMTPRFPSTCWLVFSLIFSHAAVKSFSSSRPFTGRILNFNKLIMDASSICSPVKNIDNNSPGSSPCKVLLLAPILLEFVFLFTVAFFSL